MNTFLKTILIAASSCIMFLGSSALAVRVYSFLDDILPSHLARLAISLCILAVAFTYGIRLVVRRINR